jgi:hypothetical protein
MYGSVNIFYGEYKYFQPELAYAICSLLVAGMCAGGGIKIVEIPICKGQASTPAKLRATRSPGIYPISLEYYF